MWNWNGLTLILYLTVKYHSSDTTKLMCNQQPTHIQLPNLTLDNHTKRLRENGDSLMTDSNSKYEFKLSKYEFKLSKYEFKLSNSTLIFQFYQIHTKSFYLPLGRILTGSW